MRTLYISFLVFVLFFGSFSRLFALEYAGDLRVTEVDDTQISLSWDAQDQAGGYIVYYDYTDTLDPDDPQYFEQSDPITGTSTTIENLESDAHYSFVVVALDEAGNESTNTSNQVTVKTYAARSAFGLSDVSVLTPESKKLIVFFTGVLDLEKAHSVKIIDTSTQQPLLVKGYLHDAQDLRGLQVFLNDPLTNGNTYRVEVIEMHDVRGNTFGPDQTKIKEFEASYEEEKVAGESEDLNSAEPEYTAPVEIDSLPVTGPLEMTLIFLAGFALVVSYVFFRFRKS